VFTQSESELGLGLAHPAIRGCGEAVTVLGSTELSHHAVACHDVVGAAKLVHARNAVEGCCQLTQEAGEDRGFPGWDSWSPVLLPPVTRRTSPNGRHHKEVLSWRRDRRFWIWIGGYTGTRSAVA